MEWIFVGHIESMGFGYDEYTNEDNTKCRQVWNDGYEEIFEISWKGLDKSPNPWYNVGTVKERSKHHGHGSSL